MNIVLAVLLAVIPTPPVPYTQQTPQPADRFIYSIYQHLCDKHKGFVKYPKLAISWKKPDSAFPAAVHCQDGLVKIVTAPTPLP